VEIEEEEHNKVVKKIMKRLVEIRFPDSKKSQEYIKVFGTS